MKSLVIAVCMAVFAWMFVANATTPEIVVYGDSIVVGSNTQAPWPTLLGAHVDARNGRALVDDNGAAHRIIKAGPDILWIAIGTNDWGKGRVSASEFGMAYGALLDAVLRSLPNVRIFAQTPTVRSDEVLDASGVTLDQFRDAIHRECAARARTTCVDGRTIVDLEDLDDGLHPGERAQQKYADFVSWTIGGKR